MKHLLRIRVSRPAPVWRHPDLRRIGAAQALMFLAGEVVVVASLLHAYAGGWGAAGAAAVLAVAALPLALGTLVAGPLVDRMSSRRLSVCAAGWQAVVCAAGALALQLDVHSAWLLLVLLLLQTGQAVAGPTWAALLPSAVGPDELPAAVGQVSALVMLVGLLGPVLAGGLMAVGGVAAALSVPAGLLVVVAVLGAVVGVVRPGTEAGGGPKPHVLDGLRFLRGDQVLGVLVAGFVGFVLAVELVGVVLVLLVRGDLGGGELTYGVLGSVLAVGLVVGSVLAGQVPPGNPMVRAAVIGMAGMAAALVVAGLAPGLLVLGAALLVLGAFNGIANAAAQTTLALRVPVQQRGRVLAAVAGLLRTASVLGLVVGGLLGSWVDPRTLITGAGVVGLLVAAWSASRLYRRPPDRGRGSGAVDGHGTRTSHRRNAAPTGASLVRVSREGDDGA